MNALTELKITQKYCIFSTGIYIWGVEGNSTCAFFIKAVTSKIRKTTIISYYFDAGINVYGFVHYV